MAEAGEGVARRGGEEDGEEAREAGDEEGVPHPEEELGLRALPGELPGREGKGEGEDEEGHEEKEPPLPEVHPRLGGKKPAEKAHDPHPQEGEAREEGEGHLVRVEDHPLHQLGVVFQGGVGQVGDHLGVHEEEARVGPTEAEEVVGGVKARRHHLDHGVVDQEDQDPEEEVGHPWRKRGQGLFRLPWRRFTRAV